MSQQQLLLSVEDIHLSSNPDEIYDQLKFLILTVLDFSTPKDCAVFWSGANRTYAEEYARSSGRKTLEMTPGRY